jgi:hypothetical protein
MPGKSRVHAGFSDALRRESLSEATREYSDVATHAWGGCFTRIGDANNIQRVFLRE